MTILVTGAGGFIGHHLIKFLRSLGHQVRGVDLKYPVYEETQAHQFWLADLRDMSACLRVTKGVDLIYALAADMGGMGYLSQHQAVTLYNNSLIDLNTVEAARQNGCLRLLFASSACVYPEHLQTSSDLEGLKEEDAYPACPSDAYGWGKLISERLCHYYTQDYGLETRVARFHNIFGPLGSWDGGREKAPAAICRKVAQAEIRGDRRVEVWGDGEQTRSFCYLDDCGEGLVALMESDYDKPVNLGQDRLVSINQLVQLVAQVAGVPVDIVHCTGPQGVRGRNSNNARTREVLNWYPRISLEEGLARTYFWIRDQVRQAVMV